MTDNQHACCGPARTSTDRPAQAGTTAPGDLLHDLRTAASGQLSMVGLQGGRFLMGSEDQLAYPNDHEGPVREVTVEPFAIAATTVTVAQFATFVSATAYRTEAETYGDALVFEGLLTGEDLASAPSVAETPWWRVVRGATWFRPEGPSSTVRGREDHPVTQVSQRDAIAYAQWVGARLPTEAEWEFAARGGLVQQPYPWGDEREPGGERRMNIFPGVFPDRPGGPVGTMPVGSFAPNGYGLHEPTGNVWEWTSGVFGPGDDRPVLRGGSYLCHESYCRRYRTSARTAVTADTSLGHTGFRLAMSTAS